MKPRRSLSFASALLDIPGLTSLSIVTIKELKVIIPAALGGALCMVLAMFGALTGFIQFLAFPLTCSAIGALAFGHDFMYRTLGQALALPIAREVVWRTRMRLALLVMIPMVLLAFTLLAAPMIWMSMTHRARILGPAPLPLMYSLAMVGVPVMGGLFLAPWLTLISRSPLFGVVFSYSIPAVLLSIFGVNRFVMAVLACGWVAGFILGRRAFMQLEAIDGSAPMTTRLDRTVATRKFRRQNPVWLLLKKELMLQRVPIAFGIFAAIFVFFLKEDRVTAAAMIYAPILIVLIGAVASAEERQLGVQEWQTLMPMAFWKQWSLKVLVTWTLTLLLGILLPLQVLLWKGEHSGGNLSSELPLVLAIAIFAVTASLYVSSLCRGSLKALLLALPVSAAVWMGVLSMINIFLSEPTSFDPAVRMWWSICLSLITAGGLLPPALRFAMQNHRFADAGPIRVWKQIAWFLGYAMFAFGTFLYLTTRFIT